MSVLKLSKNDIIRKEDREEKIKLKRSDLSYDSARVSGWEQANRQSLEILNNYNNRINKSEWLDKEDRATYRKALDSYIETSNLLRGINRTFGEGYSEEDEQKWADSIASMTKGYDEISGFYDQFVDDREYNNWYASETKRKEYEATRSATDFDEYSQRGANIKNPTAKDAEPDIILFGQPIGGKKVGNVVTYSIENKNALAFGEANGGGSYSGGKYLYSFMEEDEVAIYNYYLGKGETEKAEEYLDYLEDTLNRRMGGQVAKNIDGTFLEAFHSGLAGIEQATIGFRNIDNFIMGTEGETTTSTQYAQAEMSSNNTGVWKVTNDLLNTTGNMLPSILVGSMTGGLGGALTLGVSATGNAYSEMRKLGYDEWQARGYAALTGASETVLSYALGGISKLGGGNSGIFQTIAGKIIPKLDSAIARVAIDLGGNMLDEGLEEAIQSVLDPVFKMIATGEEFEGIDVEEVLYSGLLGMLSAGFLEGAPTIAGNAISTYNTNVQHGGLSIGEGIKATFKGDLKNAYNTGRQAVTESAKAYADEALEIDPENAHAQRMQARINEGKNVSGYQINRLIEANENTMVSQDKAKMKTAVESRLTELGEGGDISRLTEVIVKAQSGEKLTSSERSILVNSKYGRRVSMELNPKSIESGEYASKWAENIGTERINAEAYNRGMQGYAEQTENPSVTEDTRVTEEAVKREISAPVVEAKQPIKAVMIDTEGNDVEANVARIAEVENGEVTLELEGGQTVKASDVDFGDSGIGFVIKTATEMVSGVGGFTVDAANLMVKGVNPNISEAAANLYVAGFNEAYRYGAMGYPVSALATGGATSRLSETQRETAYNLGKAYGVGKVAAKQANINVEKTEKTGQKGKKGKVYFDGSAVGKSLTERQRASLKGLRVVAEAMGVDIHIFESPLVNGKRVGKNGWYNPATKEIHIDLHAGADGNGLMLYTASHELTHHIREVAPEKFKMFADALLEEYTKRGQSIDELIEDKIEKLSRNNRLEGMTDEQIYDLAYEELVADAAESMLVDSDALEALSKKLQAQDKSLWEKIKDFIAKLVARIRAAYEGLDPDSEEGKLVRKMTDSAERLQKLWVDALLEASEANIALAENGIIVDPKTESASLYSVRDLLDSNQQQKVSKALAERFGVTQAEAKEWLKAETSLASLILNPKYSQYLDYMADPDEVAIKTNSDYPQGTVDFSNICKKRRAFTEVMNRVLRNFPNHVFAATDLAKIRTIMEQEGMEVACAICYVEDRRQLDSVVAQDFIDSLAIYREGGKNRPDGKPFNANQLKAFSLIEGDTYTPSIYELISLDGRNSLKAKNPAMEEAWVRFNNARGMQSVRLLLNDAEYKRQILKYSASVVERKNDHGGLRIYSFSDMEMFHLIDIIQVITDSATVGLSIQGYTKVNEYARAVKDTGEKLNRSLIPKGDLGYHIENGRVILDFDTVEGIDINHPDFFDNIDNPNIGNIVIGINATQIRAAMASKFIDQIIPFHTGQSGEVLGEKGIATWFNYRDSQSERDAKTQKKSSHQINIYTEVIKAAEAEGNPIKNKVDFVNKFLEVCKANDLIPRFSEFLDVDENGDYVYTEGYHKFLVDFKTFDQNTGEYLPQMPVKPIFDNDYLTKLLTDYVKSQREKDAALAKTMPKVIERITKEIVKSDGVKYSDRDSQGTELTDEQAEFFKNSKARDEEGNLLVLYHGTDTAERITTFKTTEGWRTGLWMTTDYETAVDFARAYDGSIPKAETRLFTKGNSSDGTGGRQGVYELYANAKKPLVVDAKGNTYTVIPRPSVMGKGDAVSGEEICIYALENEYDSVIINNIIEGGGRLGTNVIVFSPNQVKYTDNLNPTESNDIRYSDRDSQGNSLSNEQQSFFRDSKVRDENGRLLYLYHGTKRGGFTEFVDTDDIGYFFTDREDNAGTYSGTYTEYAPKRFDSWEEAISYAKENDLELYYDDDASEYVLADGWTTSRWAESELDSIADELNAIIYGDGEKVNYAVYLNLTDPLIIEGNGSNWSDVIDYYEGGEFVKYEDLTEEQIEGFLDNGYDESDIREFYGNGGESLPIFDVANFNINYPYSTRDWVAEAQAGGYDGVIFKNIWDSGSEFGSYGYESNVYVALRPEQIKSVNNKKPTSNPDIRYSDRVTDKKTLDFLEHQEHVTVYRAMQVIDGELYPPMAARVKSDDGKKALVTPSKIGTWEQAVERPDLIRNGNKFELDKANGSSIQAAYNPYFHTSASPLNDQFSSAYKRPNLVIVEGVIPVSELTSGYRAEFAKDTVGETRWHSGPVASKLKGDKARRVFLSRWFKPMRIVPDSEVASIVAKTLEGENIDVPYNVVTPSLRAELERAGVSIKYQDRDPDSYSNRSLLAGALETAAQNDIERRKLEEYKQKIDLINAEEQRLHELREQIKALSFAKGPRDTQAIRNLQFEANQAANRINTYDRQLLNLESTKALKGVLEREKAQARKKAEQRAKEALERQRERAAKTQRELMDRYQESRKKATESRNKTAMRHKIKDVVNELNQYLLRGTKDKHVPIELQKAVAEALDAVNMDTVGAEERIARLQAEMMRAKTPEAVQEIAKKIEHIQEMGGNMAKKISRLKTAYDSIINSDDPLVANSHDEVISNSITRVMELVGDVPLRDMSLSQLEAVYDMYKMVLHSIRNANRAFKAKKSEEISVIAGRVMEEVDNLGKKKRLQSKAGQVISEFDWNNQKPVYAFARIGSDTFTEVFNNVRAGEDVWATDMTEAQEFLGKQKSTHKYDSWDFDKKHTFTSSSGMKFELNLPQIMSLYAYSKREQAAEHLKRGGIVFDETTEVTVKNKLGIPVRFNPTEATAYNISEETLADIISKLTAEQKAFVDAMQDYLSTTMGEKGNEVSLELYGVKLFTERHYFPLKSATQFMAKAKEQQKGEVKIKNSGFSKETVYKANNPIVLTPFMDVWAGHVNEMSMYHAFVLALEDFYRVYNYKTPTSETMATESVEMFLQNAHGKGATKYIDQLLKDLNGGARVDTTAGIINKLTGLFKKSAVFASASVVVQQPSAIARATALVDTKYFVGKPSKHKETWVEVKKYAPVAVIKEMGYFDTGMGKSSVEWLKGEKTFMDKVDDFAAKAPALADEYAWCAIWNAVKRETAHNNPKLKTSSEEFLKLVGERFTEVVTKTQVYDSVLSRSANMRSKDTGMKMATAFMGEPTTSLNIIQDALIQGKRGNKKYAAKAIGGVISSMILNSILVSIVYAGRDDDEDKTYAEKYISTLTEELLDSFNPLTLIPFVKDIVSIVQGYDIERSDMAVITDLINAWNNLDSDNRSVYRKVEDFGGAIASIFGLPVKNVMRDVRGIYNTINSFINGEKTTGAGIGNAVKEAITGKETSNGQQLYEAMVSGDSAQVKRIEGRFEDQAAIDAAIRKALRENDPRIRKAAEAFLGGDFATYNSLREEIISEGKFSRQIVNDALKAEYNYIKKKANENK